MPVRIGKKPSKPEKYRKLAKRYYSGTSCVSVIGLWISR
jgi:hypothetical protein